MRRVVIMGAGGRDFHDFARLYRDDAAVEVVAFTAAQIPGIAGRTFPSALAGPRYPAGIPIRPEEELAAIVREQCVDEVLLAYSDLAHEDVMHRASIALAAGADFRLAGPRSTMLECAKPVVAVCAARTGSGKSQTSRRIGELLRERGLAVALVRHPMPYGDLEAMRVQRFASLADIDAAHPTIEEREEYELPVSLGITVWAGVDYEAILPAAAGEADVVIWDGGNNDFPFVRPDLLLCVVDALRPGHELRYHPGETVLRLADVVVVNKVDAADPGAVDAIVQSVHRANPRATVIRTASPVTLDDGPPVVEARVLVVEDGPSVTHGGLPYGAGTVAARAAGAYELVDPRPFAVGSIRDAFRRYPDLGLVVPAMGYSDDQLGDLVATIDAAECDVVVSGTPVDLARLVHTRHPIRRARYGLADAGEPTLADVLAPLLGRVDA